MKTSNPKRNSGLPHGPLVDDTVAATIHLILQIQVEQELLIRLEQVAVV